MTFRDFYLQSKRENKFPARALLFDIDGTLISGPAAMPGADETLKLLREDGMPFLMLTNDSCHSQIEKNFLLARAGVHARPEDIISCSSALTAYVRENDLHGRRAFVVGELGTPDYAELSGLEVCRDADLIEECDLVVMGEGKGEWQSAFNGMLNYYINDPTRPLVVANPDSYWPDSSTGKMGIGSGAQARFVAGVLKEMQIEIEPVYLGKPHRYIFEFAVEYLRQTFGLKDLSIQDVMMIGDGLHSDIAGARAISMPSALVMTGVTTPEILAAAPETRKPDYIFDSIG